MFRRTATLLVIPLFCNLALAQRPYPLSGGTKTEPDPKFKKAVRIVAESERLRLTLGATDRYRPGMPVVPIWLKVENLSEHPIKMEIIKFSAVDNEGRGYAGLEPQDAIKKVFDASSRAMWVAGSIAAGPLAGPGLVNATERKFSEDVSRDSLQPGDVPPHSFKDGLVFFESGKKPPKTLKVSLGDLWSEPFVFEFRK